MSAREQEQPELDILRTMNIQRATSQWLGELERHGHSERTIDTYGRLLDKLAAAHDLDVHEITPALLRSFLDGEARKKRGGRKAPATIAQNVSIVNGFFDWLTREGAVRHNPTRRNGDRIIGRPKQPAPDENDNITTVTSSDVEKLIAAAETMGWPYRLAIGVLVGVGPRRHAASALRVRDYDPEAATLTFREKGSRTITKPIPDQLQDLLVAAFAAGVYSSVDEYLVPSRGTPRNPERDDRALWHIVREVAEEAGVETHVHALRAAFAVHFLEAKPGRVVALQKLMGHKRIETTMVYLRRLDRRAEMESVRDVSWGNGQGEIRTREPVSPGHSLSRRAPSATRAPVQGFSENGSELVEAIKHETSICSEPSFDAIWLLLRTGSEQGNAASATEVADAVPDH